jgi:hypothetical protein
MVLTGIRVGPRGGPYDHVLSRVMRRSRRPLRRLSRTLGPDDCRDHRTDRHHRGGGRRSTAVVSAFLAKGQAGVASLGVRSDHAGFLSSSAAHAVPAVRRALIAPRRAVFRRRARSPPRWIGVSEPAGSSDSRSTSRPACRSQRPARRSCGNGCRPTRGRRRSRRARRRTDRSAAARRGSGPSACRS